MRTIPLLLLLSAVLSCQNQHDKDLQIDKLTCNYATNPINIDTPVPRFSWITTSSIKGNFQKAYRIIVADNKKELYRLQHLKWDTGKRLSDTTLHIVYEGKQLKSNSEYFWKVIVWDKDGRSVESETASFGIALTDKKEWKAKWIGYNDAPESVPPKGFYADPKEEALGKDSVRHNGRSVLLRRGFSIGKKIKRARLYVTGLGFYEAYLNGERIGNNVLSPAKTPYYKYVLYDTYDVTRLLKEGNNVIGLHLGNGWYNPYKKWWNTYRMQWFGYKKAIAQLMITLDDGTTQTVVTDNKWTTSPGPVLFSCVYDGEVYDANSEVNGWNKPGFDDSAWKKAVLMHEPAPGLISSVMPPVRVTDTLDAVKVTDTAAGTRVFDFGQNFAGRIRLKMKGRKGTKITIRFSEELKEDGTLDLTCNENAGAVAVYILKGRGIETYEPHFTYFGFQYAEVSSDSAMPEIISVKGCVIHSANEPVGRFKCSYPLINKMHHATVWSQKSNMIGYPMDCPQRDERLGWLGDAQVTAEEAMFNFDMALFYKNWFRGLRANQDEKSGDITIISPRPYIPDEGVEWSSSYFTMVWQFYVNYGDKQVLVDNYKTMKRYMAFLKKLSDNYKLPKGWIGDWGSMVKGWKEGEPESVPTAYYFYDAVIMSKIARVLGRRIDEDHFSDLAGAIRERYNKTYFNAKTKNYNDGSQMANAFPLFLGIVPEKFESAVLENIVNDIKKNGTHLTTGVLGTKYLFEALLKYGRNDIAWSLATQTSYPSWSEMMKRYNTMCEFWTLKQSHNHVMMGSIDSWFYKALAGIQTIDSVPAFKTFVIRPYTPKGLEYVTASTKTIRGSIVSRWKKTDSGLLLHIEVPFNTKAIVYVPESRGKTIYSGNKKAAGAKGIRYLSTGNDCVVFEVRSGKYDLTVK